MEKKKEEKTIPLYSTVLNFGDLTGTGVLPPLWQLASKNAFTDEHTQGTMVHKATYTSKQVNILDGKYMYI